MDANRLLSAPSDTYDVDTQTAATATAELATPGAKRRWIITGVAYSADRAPTTALVVQVKDGSTVIRQYEVSLNAFSPQEHNFTRGLRCGLNNAASITCGTGGASVKVTLCICGFTVGE